MIRAVSPWPASPRKPKKWRSCNLFGERFDPTVWWWPPGFIEKAEFAAWFKACDEVDALSPDFGDHVPPPYEPDQIERIASWAER